MTAVLTTIWNFIKSNMWAFVFLAVGIAILFFNLSCESTVPSILTPSPTDNSSLIHTGKQVTREELAAELSYITSIAEKRFADLDRQDALRKMIGEQAVIIAAGGALNPAGIISLLMGIFGVGAIIDNRKKQNTITNQALDIASLQKSISLNGS
jgi:hypothetical protein